MSLKKQYTLTKPICKVTFKLAKDDINGANRVYLAGDFNNWDIESIPMKKLKSGEYTISIDLEKGKEYQFKYVIDGMKWINETEADKYVPNQFLTENSVVVV